MPRKRASMKMNLVMSCSTVSNVSDASLVAALCCLSLCVSPVVAPLPAPVSVPVLLSVSAHTELVLEGALTLVAVCLNT